MLSFFLAYNGHTECLQLLLKHAEAEDVVDCVDGQDRLEGLFISHKKFVLYFPSVLYWPCCGIALENLSPITSKL